MGRLEEAQRGIRLLGGELRGLEDYAIPGSETRRCAVVVRKIADTPARYPRRWAQMKKQPL